jgi:6-phospho-3-hexuloisomerase
MNFSDVFPKMIENIKEVLLKVDDKTIDISVDILKDSSTIFVYGAGRSGIVARSFAMRLVQLGLKTYIIGESVTPIVKENDAVVIVSNKGESFSSVQVGNIVRRVGAKLIVFTSNPNSKLAHISSVKVTVPSVIQDKNMPLGTLFEASCYILFDAMISILMNKLNESEESMRARHAIMV